MSLFSSLKSFVGGTSKSVVGIDIGSSEIKVVQVHSEKGTAVLDTYGSIVLGPYVEGAEFGQRVNADAETLSNALLTVMRETKVTSSLACVSIPFVSSFIKLIKVPPVSDEKIGQMIPREAKRYIMAPLNDIGIDWFIVPRMLLDSDNKSIFEDEQAAGMPVKEQFRHVLLIAVFNHAMLKLRDVINRSKMSFKCVEAEVFSAIRASTYGTKLPYMIVDIGTSTTKFYVVYKGIVVLSMSLNQGGQSITNVISQTLNIPFVEAEYKKRELGFDIPNEYIRDAILLVMDETFALISKLMLEFEQEYRRSVSEIVLMGGGASMKGVLEETKKKVRVEVKVADPFAHLRYPALLTEELRESGSVFTVAVGAALRALENK